MGHVGSPLIELTAQAWTKLSAGDLMGARQLLADGLDSTSAAGPQPAESELAPAAALHARVLLALGDASGALRWADFAHCAEQRLHGPLDEPALAAAATYAAVLQRVGDHENATQLYSQLVTNLSELDGPDTPRVLAAEADLATAEHAAGRCTAARNRLSDAGRRYRQRYGDAAPAGIKMLARLGAMERACGRDGEASKHLALTQELCARYLPADHQLVRQAAALAITPTTRTHRCDLTSPNAEQFVTAAPKADPAPPPFTPAVPNVDDPNHTDSAAARSGADPGLGTFAEVASRLAPELRRFDAGEPRFDLGVATHAGLAVSQSPVGVSQFPSAWSLSGVSRTEGALAVPAESPRWLPVLVRTAPVRRSRQPAVLATVFVAGVAVAAAVVLLTSPDPGKSTRATALVNASAPAPTQPEQTGSAPTAGSAPTGSGLTGSGLTGSGLTGAGSAGAGPAALEPSVAVSGAAPAGVQLRDNGASVSLHWTYPPGAAGPVLISGGQVGQQQRAFMQLPAGSIDYDVHGLAAAQNYCFTVAVAYSTNVIADSAPTCTRR